MSRGVMLQSSEHTLQGLEGQVRVTLTNEMAPKSRVVVYGIIDENKEILVDAMDFDGKLLSTNTRGLLMNL